MAILLIYSISMPRPRNRGLRANWSADAIQNAISAIQNGMAVNTASKTFLIPRRTLRDYLKKGKTTKCSMGRKTIISAEQEEELCRRIIRLAEIGYPLTARVLRRCVFNFCKANNIQNKFNVGKEMAGRFWLKNFFKRHPEIRVRKAQNMNPARAQKLNKYIVTDHFNKLRDILTDLDIMDKPQFIYNMDEKGCRLGLHHQQGVLAKKGAKRVHLVANEHGENVTVVSCGNAIGTSIPPFIIFKGKRMKPELADDLPPGSKVIMTQKASMTIEAFKMWLSHFSQYRLNGPCLLIFDGAKCHLDYSIVTHADELGITLYCLPSNTTHELQPMDKSVFRSFEHYWDDELLKFWARHKDRALTKQRFGGILSVVWDKCMTPSNIKSGFSACGIYPFNPEIIPIEAYAPSSVTEIKDIPNIPEMRNQLRPSPRREDPQEDRQKTPSPQPGPSKSLKTKRQVLPTEQYNDDSDSTNSDMELSKTSTENENTDDEDKPKEKANVSFSEMLLTPDMAQKTLVKRKPALNSKAQVVTKDIFKNSDSNAKSSIANTNGKSQSKKPSLQSFSTRNVKPISRNKSRQSQVSHQAKNKESWYCKACKQDRVADMHLCFVCQCYLHDECVGLTKEDKEERYICPYCS